jgi:hypothetical protein
VTAMLPEEGQQMALLSELATLLRQYGSETFRSLAARLDDPSFARDLSRLLKDVEAAAPPRQQRSSRRKQTPRERLEGVAAKVRTAPEETRAILGPLIEEVLAGRLAPQLRDVRVIAERSGLRVGSAHTRDEALASLFSQLLDSPASEIGSRVAYLRSLLEGDQRSLEGWSHVIARSRAELGP